jgi:hypothetical protein
MPQVKKEKKEEIIWDKKKIIFFVGIAILLIVLAINLKSAILGESYSPKSTKISTPAFKGISAQDLSKNIRQSILGKINDLQNEAHNIDVAEIASSSPQVQKILKDLKSLKDLPKSQFRDACEKVCAGF